MCLAAAAIRCGDGLLPAARSAFVAAEPESRHRPESSGSVLWTLSTPDAGRLSPGVGIAPTWPHDGATFADGDRLVGGSLRGVGGEQELRILVPAGAAGGPRLCRENAGLDHLRFSSGGGPQSPGAVTTRAPAPLGPEGWDSPGYLVHRVWWGRRRDASGLGGGRPRPHRGPRGRG